MSTMKFDERDLMFSRMARKEGTVPYREYYSRNPQKKQIDDMLRAMPGLLNEILPSHEPLNSPMAKATFRFLSDIRPLSDGKVEAPKKTVVPSLMADKLKKYAAYHGADVVGIARLKKEHYYSYRGRRDEVYGEEINEQHAYAIVFAVEMDADMVAGAPLMSQTIETTHCYLKNAAIGMMLSYYIRELGFEARNHMDGNYLMPLAFVAEDAGIGEIGRSGIVVTEQYGQRIRLGAVTTNMPLVAHEKQALGIKEFCALCDKCACACLGKAISKEQGNTDINGYYTWKTEVEKCFRVWQKIGTDCGVCLAVCPFSKGITTEEIHKMKNNPAYRKEVIDRFPSVFRTNKSSNNRF